MSITVTEKFSGRKQIRSIQLNGSSIEREFIAVGSTVEVDVINQVYADTPSTLDGLPRQTAELEEIGSGIGMWSVRVRWAVGSRQNPTVDQTSYQFSTAGGTQHILQSKETVHSYSRLGDTAPNYKGAINVTADSVDGCDITVPVFNFQETHYFSDSAVDDTFKGNLFRLTGKTNSAVFRGFQIGELLFLGAEGSKRGTLSTDLWEIRYSFAASENATGLSVGDITGIEKKGWEYLWVRYQQVEDTVAHSVVRRPENVYVERVYDAGNFSLLGI